MTDISQASKWLKDKSKNGLSHSIVIIFLIHMNAKLDSQADEIKEIKESQAKYFNTVDDHSQQLKNGWKMFNKKQDEGGAVVLNFTKQVGRIEQDIAVLKTYHK